MSEEPVSVSPEITPPVCDSDVNAFSVTVFAAPEDTFAPSVNEPAVVVSVVSPPDVTAPVVAKSWLLVIDNRPDVVFVNAPSLLTVFAFVSEAPVSEEPVSVSPEITPPVCESDVNAFSVTVFAAPEDTLAPSVSEPAVVVSVVSPPDVTAPVVVSA